MTVNQVFSTLLWFSTKAYFLSLKQIITRLFASININKQSNSSLVALVILHQLIITTVLKAVSTFSIKEFFSQSEITNTGIYFLKKRFLNYK